MTVIQKTIQIPESHQIMLDLPGDIQAGDTAEIVVTITVSPKTAPEKSILELAGAFADSKTFSGDSVALIREIRDEW
jgi:hypothetical protein